MHDDLELDLSHPPSPSVEIENSATDADDIDEYDHRFDDPMSPDYVGPSLPFSEAGFKEVIDALEAPEDTPERLRTFERAREAAFLVDRLWDEEAKRCRP